MSSSIDIAKTFGALLLGGFFASLLSGTVLLQTFVYFRLYPFDFKRIKSLVAVIWLLDASHTAFVWSSIWAYLISDYGNAPGIDDIHWCIALSIEFTAILTFLVHCFFAHRIYLLSRKNWFLTGPIVILALLRLASASVTTAEMLRLGTFSSFKAHFRWVFTLGLALSSSVDFLITGSLFWLLQSSRTGAERLNEIIDSLILYTFETGSLTCAATIVSMICWLVIPGNLIFMGLHFVIGKLYATSLLVTLNTRSTLRRGADYSMYSHEPVLVLDTRRPPNYLAETAMVQTKPTEVQVSIERSIQYTVQNRHYSNEIYGARTRSYSSDRVHSSPR